jgi:glucose-6-phosphate 1-dehydrogenase
VVLGAARTEMSNSTFRALMKDAVKTAFPDKFDRVSWRKFSQRLYYSRVDYGEKGSFLKLRKKILALEKKHETRGNRIFYLAVPPAVYEPVISNIGSANL